MSMLVAAVVCLGAAALLATLGTRALIRSGPTDRTQEMLRSLAPTQLAGAVMLGAGGVIALSSRSSVGLLVLCAVGALGTIAAGAWQAARYAHADEPATCRQAGGQDCGSCNLSCG